MAVVSAIRCVKAIEDRAEPEPVIPVTVRDVHGGEVPVVRSDPLDQVVCLTDGQERVDEDGISLARDQRRRYRRSSICLLLPEPGRWPAAVPIA